MHRRRLHADDAAAFLSYGDVRVDGAIELHGSGLAPPPGAITSGTCVGHPGNLDIGNTVGFWADGGGGATQGGAGGSYFERPGSLGGAVFVNPDLRPLRGGCSGGNIASEAPVHGGGALQITSSTQIHLGPNTTLQLNGSPGFAAPVQGFPGFDTVPKGGGSGGGLLLEAPDVTFDSGVVLVANGGAGASGDGNAATEPIGRVPSSGGPCVAAPTMCTNGGDGGSVAGPGRTASSITATNLQELHLGAGGGSVGYIRINTKDGTYTKASDVFESPTPSSGSIDTK